MKTVRRYDISSIDFMDIDSNGFLRGDGIVTRVGVFTYANSDGTLRKELRHPDDVLLIGSLNTMRMIPVTDGHTEMVNPSNYKRLAVGHVGENIRPDGSHVVAPVVINDELMINKVEGGQRALSLGYKVDLIDEKGEYDGQVYDCRQTNIRYNHLAIVNRGRAGADAKLKFDGFNLDGDDAILVEEEEKKKDKNKSVKKKCDTGINNPKKEVKRMDSSHNLDGISYPCAPEISNFINKLQSKFDTLDAENTANLDKIADLETKVDTITAERDDARDKLKVLEEKDNTDEVNAAVKERVDILSVVNKVIKDGKIKVDGKDKKIDDATNVELKKAVILSQYPDVNFDEKSDDYINARYDAVIEGIDKKAIGDQRKKVNTDVDVKNEDGDDEKIDADDARDKMMKDMRSAHLSKS